MSDTNLSSFIWSVTDMLRGEDGPPRRKEQEDLYKRRVRNRFRVRRR